MAIGDQVPRGLFAGAQRMPGLLGRLNSAAGRLFGGADDPRLSAQQNEQARRQAQLQAGLAMLANPGQPGQGALAGIAQGAMYGQQAGMQSREQAVQMGAQQAAQERLRAAVGNGGPIDRQALSRIFVEAVASGDTEMAGRLSEVLKAMPAEGVVREPVRGSPEWIEMRRRELDLEREYARPTAPVPGTPEYTAMLEERARIAAKYRPAPRTTAGSEGERKAAAFAGMVADGTQFIDTVTNAPGRIEQAASDKGLREFNDDEQQRLQLAGNALAEAWLRMTTGAAYNDQEFSNAYNLFVPRPGDRKAALDWKRRNRQRLQEMIRTHSGRLAPSEGEVTAGDFDPFGDL